MKRPQSVKEPAKPALVPKLRFPGFEGDLWKSQPLQTVANFVDDRISVHDIGRKDYVSTENLLPDFGGISPASSLPATGSVVRYQMNDVLAANIRPYLKKIWLADKSGGASNDVIVIRARSSTGHIYLAQVLKSDRFISYVMSGAKGLKMPRGDVALIREYPVPLPSAKAEQQKIAECLSTLDELMTAESQKLDALKTHKKGLMQKLFPREGETLPRLRFPEFRDAGEWERKAVDELVETVTPPKKLQTADYRPEGQFPVIDQSQDYICGWTDDADAAIKSDLPVVVFGDHTCALKFVARPFAQGADGIKILKAKAEVRDDFLFFSLQASPVQQESYKRHFSTLRERVIAFPERDSGEQYRIASCLSSLDDLIAAQSDQLEALKTHKKGLMQQLFPSPAEVEA